MKQHLLDQNERPPPLHHHQQQEGRKKMPWPQKLTVSEKRASICELVLTIFEVLTAIAAIVLSALALNQSIGDDVCMLQTNFNSTQDAVMHQANGKNTTCLYLSDDKAICCGQDLAGIYINAGLLQLACAVFLILTLRFVLTLFVVGREVNDSKAEAVGPGGQNDIAMTSSSINTTK